MTKSLDRNSGRLFGLALGVFLSLTACGKPPQVQGSAPPPMMVKTQNLTNSKILESSEYLGRIEAANRVNLAPRVEGRITEIAVREGDLVKQGQLIVQLQPEREQAEVSSALSQVSISQADLVNADAQVKSAEAQVAQAQAQVEQSKADLQEQAAAVSLAQTNIERAQFLVKEGAESKQFLDDSTKELESALARQAALKQALNASQKALSAAEAGVNAAIANVDRQKASLNQAQAQVGVASQNLDFNRIVAPVDGIVGNLVPKVGDYLEAGDSITTITSNESLTVNIGVPIADKAKLRLGLPVAVISQRDLEPVRGRISFISPTTTQQSILIKAAIPNNGQLQDEQSVLTKVIWQEKPGILVPTIAISRIAGENFVFVAEQIEQEGQTQLVAKQKLVKLGDIQGQSYQVLSGLEPGDNLITSGILNLRDGIPVSLDQETATLKVTSNQ